jgi:hypothetical protein
LQCISKSLFICSVDFLVRTASTRSNAKTVSQAEHFHAIGLLVWSLKTVAVRTGIAIVSHGPIQDASLAETTPPRALIQKAHLTVAKHPDCTHNPGGKTAAPVRSAAWGATRPGGSRESASRGLLLWQAERNQLPVFFRRYPLRCFFAEAGRYEEFNDLRHKSPHL